jgi:pimeloyl-ACP methyl ester carboxylesterase
MQPCYQEANREMKQRLLYERVTYTALRTVTVEGAGSLPHLSRPDAVWEVLAEFLSE